MNLCEYKDALGKPNKGIHSTRVFGLAFWDIVMTLVGGVMLSRPFRLSISRSIVILFIIGIVSHRVFCVRTTIDKLLFPQGIDDASVNG
jgi:hypothetical protein